MKFFLALIFIGLLTRLSSQVSDLNLIMSHRPVDTSIAKKRAVSYAFKGKNWFVQYNPLSLLLGGGLFFYQKVLSPQIVMGCAFNPSCSSFSKGCINEFGLIKGVALSSDRLTRCTRLSAIDFHPVHLAENGKMNDPPSYYHLKSK